MIASGPKKEIAYKPFLDNSLSYMCQEHIDYFKSKLLKMRADIVDATNLEYYSESAKDGLDNIEQYDLLFLKLKKIEIALEKIKNNKYGYCDISGQEIGLKRLDALPTAVLCIEEQINYDKQ